MTSERYNKEMTNFPTSNEFCTSLITLVCIVFEVGVLLHFSGCILHVDFRNVIHIAQSGQVFVLWKNVEICRYVC